MSMLKPRYRSTPAPQRPVLRVIAIALLACGCAADTSGGSSAAQGELLRSVRSQTYAYKTVDGLQIKADVHRLDDAVTRPVVVWIHGGALIMGNRGSLRGFPERLVDEGYVVVSIDYRLAPETMLPQIIEDVEDAFAWVAAEGRTLYHADTDRIGVMGESAGGYLTLVSGFRAEPRPDALVSVYGYGDLIGEWYSQPSPHPRHNRRPISAEEAYAQVDGPPISDSRDRDGNGGIFYNYARQRGSWPKEISGWDPHTEAERFDPFMPLVNVTSEYPPTMLIHGTADTDVPYEQSTMMAAALAEHDVPHELVTVEGAEHGLAGADRATVEAAYADALAWLSRYLR